MKRGQSWAALDLFRIAAAVLVVAIHTSPLTTYSPLGDFWFTRIFARVAVPFFLMVSGYFLAKQNWKATGRFLQKSLQIYGAAVLLYFPLNWYSGGFATPLEWLQKLLIDGTLYHLWYFPAVILGVLIARELLRMGLPAALIAAAILYAVGLGGDSYYGLLSALPPLHAFYEGIFSIFTYTRNGLFFAPLFLLLGAAGIRLNRVVSSVGFCITLAAMSAEGLWLHAIQAQRHDSMYVFLPFCIIFLFSLLLSVNRGQNRRARECSMLVYLIHPWCIVLVRGGAKIAGWEALLIQNSLGHFFAVLLLSLGLAWAFCTLHGLLIHPKACAWREIDCSALRHNAKVLQKALPPRCKLMAVVKADAYGHGAKITAHCLQKQGIHAFAAANLSEGIALRKAGMRGTVLILGYTPPQDAPLLRQWRLTQAVVDASYAQALAAQGEPVHVHLALDTGMHRLGIPAENHAAFARIYQLEHLRIDGVFSHLCVCDSLAPADVDYTLEQLTLFYDTVAWLRSNGYNPGNIHIQASYGILNLPAQPCQYARVGIALYGVYSDTSPVQRRLDLRPVLSLRARIASVRTLQPGDYAGYGRAFQAERETQLAAVAIGYADGLPRDLPLHGGQVLLRGRRCPMVGRMCMDQLLIDVTGLEEVLPGEVVTLIGRDGKEEIRAEEVAQWCGTITNELLSRLGLRLQTIPKAKRAAKQPRKRAKRLMA